MLLRIEQENSSGILQDGAERREGGRECARPCWGSRQCQPTSCLQDLDWSQRTGWCQKALVQPLFHCVPPPLGGVCASTCPTGTSVSSSLRDGSANLTQWAQSSQRHTCVGTSGMQRVCRNGCSERLPVGSGQEVRRSLGSSLVVWVPASGFCLQPWPFPTNGHCFPPLGLERTRTSMLVTPDLVRREPARY